MDRPGRGLRRAAAAGLASAVAAATLAGPALAGTQAAARGPVVKLVVAQNSITLTSFRGRVYLDPGVYVASLGSALQFDVRRASYTKPVTLTQVIYRPGGGTTTRSLPGSLLDGFNGLRDFLRLSVADTAGTVVASTRPLFCLNEGPQRAVPDSARTNPYPPGCGFDPFPKSLVMGLARGWAADPAGFSASFPPPTVRLAPGTYKVTATIAPQYVRLLHITAADATASVKLTVVKGRGCCAAAAPKAAPGRARALAPLPRVPHLASPPAAALPDLVPLPSWDIRAVHDRRSGRDLLTFGATVWVGGNSPLDVEGFRSNGSPVMKAYQYFWRNGHVIGRARAGTMGFDSKPRAQPLALRAVRPVHAARLREDPGGAQPQGRLLHRAERPGEPARAARRVAAAVHRPRRRLRLADRPVGAGNDAGRLGRHLPPVHRGPGLRHHQRAERHLLHRDHRQPAAHPLRVEHP